jgi:hypothetical protein
MLIGITINQDIATVNRQEIMNNRLYYYHVPGTTTVHKIWLQDIILIAASGTLSAKFIARDRSSYTIKANDNNLYSSINTLKTALQSNFSSQLDEIILDVTTDDDAPDNLTIGSIAASAIGETSVESITIT